MKKALFLFILFPFALSAQEVSIAEGSYTGCGTFIVDSGMGPADYGPNENFTFVACPGDGETVLNLNWIIFDLVNPEDVMTIYDGADTDAPEIGSYTGFELQSQNITSGVGNTTGCLTLVFVSGPIGGGNFAAQLSCGAPCVAPVVNVETGLDNPALICPGQEITFDATGTVTGDGNTIVEYVWEFGDGSTQTTTGSVVTHTYENPGSFRLDLFVTDDNGCTNDNLADVILLVSTEPTFEGISTDVEVCVGQEVDITGAVQGVTWDPTPDPNLGGGFFIPDDQTQCFDSQLTFNSFAPGAVIESPDDFESFYVNMEHSFMGDLVISLVCPNGQSMIVHQQGGGGTYLGIPVDNDDANPTPGTGFDYWWAPDATNGTWAQASAGVATLPSGTYSSVQPWTLLNGCPLNGTWTIEICDLWSIDNGYVFDWGVTFAPDLYPDLISFTPTFGEDCDSTFWTGPNIVAQTENCNTATAQPTEPGTTTYTFNAINNHGCLYTQDVNIIAVQGPIAAVPEMLYFCGDPLNLDGSIENPNPGETYSYGWSPSELLSNPNLQNPSLSGLDEPTVFTLTVAPADAPECASSADVLVDIPPMPIGLNADDLEGCVGAVFGVAAPEQPEGWSFNYAWYNLDVSETEAIWDGEILQVSEDGLYELIVTMNEPCNYAASGQFSAFFELCELGDIPNIFSPNNDGINDTFRIDGLEFFTGSRLEVYNRWGTLVYESDNYQNNWRPSEDEVSEGTYFYVLSVNFQQPRGIEVFTGDVMIVRTTRPRR